MHPLFVGMVRTKTRDSPERRAVDTPLVWGVVKTKTETEIRNRLVDAPLVWGGWRTFVRAFPFLGEYHAGLVSGGMHAR
jgi:hypothetical protein